jgi:3',5'-nucleoside bisphosphate phosphatase
MIDLHTHSTASDGQYPASELVALAVASSVSVLAVTDHDTVSGLGEAGKAALKAGITLVPGVELDIQWPTGEFHLLGLGMTHISDSLEDILAILQSGRRERNERIIKKMQEDGIHVSLEDIENLYPDQMIGRPHFAGFLVQNHIVKTRQQAFDNFLAKGRPWYFDRTGADLDEAVSAISESGGLPVIAHPLSLYISWGRIEPVLENIHARGVKGLEAWHPGARVTECRRLEELGREIGFFITAGSDFHGEKIRADRKIGRTSGGLKIEDRFWTEELLPHLNGFMF